MRFDSAIEGLNSSAKAAVIAVSLILSALRMILSTMRCNFDEARCQGELFTVELDCSGCKGYGGDFGLVTSLLDEYPGVTQRILQALKTFILALLWLLSWCY